MVRAGLVSGSLLACGGQVQDIQERSADDPTERAGSGGGVTEEIPISDREVGPTGTAHPPAPPNAPATDGDEATILATSSLFLGDTDRHGVPAPDAWKQYGFDLDNVASDVNNTYHCQAVEGGKKKDIRVNGEGGIDNSFGKNVLAALGSVMADPTAQASKALAQGTISLLLRMDRLGTGANYTGILTQLFNGQGPAGSDGGITAPTPAQLADGTYAWHPFADQLDADGAAHTSFPGAYLVDNTLVSGLGRSEIYLEIPLGGIRLPLVIHRAWLAVPLAPDHRSGTAGNIGGVLTTMELVHSFQLSAGMLSTSLCDGPTFESLATQIKQASDILADSTQDPAKVCDGISIGLGFETTAALLGDPAPASIEALVPCP
jgi:hypothetical protein